MRAERPFVLSIGGLDPCAGAGILSDIKSYDQMNVNGLAVTTCLTGQSHDEVFDISWLNEEEILLQLEPLLHKYRIDHCKIAVIKDWNLLNKIVDRLMSVNSEMKIILDPIFRASSGFEFCSIPDEHLKIEVLRKVYLITPNQEEFDLLDLKTGSTPICNILLKSAKGEERGTDLLITSDGEVTRFDLLEIGFEKHGSGCVLSSSITAYMALGEDLKVAISFAKKNIENYMTSSTNLIGTLNK